ncbi:trans-sulfuration enzyme family protein [Clostridium hydrogeniformans]|uniref:trans-sulfuration enzyme family protein n=1 Tax=Clostridium hydrogeniformans TaxID=349933 RepID=UPI0004868AFA|nr:PLP-dependent aspartate aminotransferase family protein [Clostridium hydrogeniformans]
MRIKTALIHGGIDGDEFTGAVNIPIYQTSTYKQEELNKTKGFEYSRTGNPTRGALEKLIADLEEGERGLAFASGMAAITAIISLFKSGDKILISDNLYGGTFRVLDKVFSNFNIEYSIVNTKEIGNIEKAIDSKVKGIFIETPTNPLMHITDIREVSALAKGKGILTIVDNTFMTPYYQRPLTLGADIVIHSGTKYLGGHSDVVAGVIVVKDKELGEKLHFIQNSTGGILGPFDSFLLIRGIKTLGVRMDRHNENAKKIAAFLEDREEVSKVYYPGLSNHPGYSIHRCQSNGFSGMISFLIKKEYDYREFLRNLKIITLGESLGGVESLICHPSSMTHGAIPKDIRETIGIKENLLRLSVGIEDVEDIKEDLINGFNASRKKNTSY